MSDIAWWPWVLVYPVLVVGVMVTLWALQRVRPTFGRRTAIALSILAAATYLVWRVLFTLPTDSGLALVVGIVLVTVEIIGFVQLLAFAVVVWKPVASPAPPLSSFSRLPSVDVFIATYNESPAMLRPTIAGAMGMRYPGRVTVYVCDDGSRDEVREMAEELGAVHVQREEHSHAKAGNLNHALTVSDGDIIVTQDADMIPRTSFLEASIGFFVDEDLAFAQAPQAFYNEDPFQFNLFSGHSLPNEQDFFMRTLQAGKARFNAVTYVGSNTIFRRTALEEIGGFATGVITEDMATGQLLQASGRKSVFVPDVIAAGLSPERLGDMLTQRDRWARGNIQAAKKWNPLTLPGLTPIQRWLYLDGVVYWYFGVFKLVYVLVPLMFLMFGIPALDTDLESLAVFWFPAFIASMLSFRIVADRKRSALWSHIYDLVMTPTLAVSALAETLGVKVTSFAVTPKGRLSSDREFQWRVAAPHMVLVLITVLALVNTFGLGRVASDIALISAFWALYNLLGLVMAVLTCIERPRLRASERTRVDLPAQVEVPGAGLLEARVVDLSVGGARVDIPWTRDIAAKDFVRHGYTPSAVLLPDVGRLPGEVRWVVTRDDGLQVSFRFDPIPGAQTVALVSIITSSPWWVRDDRELAAYVVMAAGRTVSGTMTPASSHARQQARQLHTPAATLAVLQPTPSREGPTGTPDSSGRSPLTLRPAEAEPVDARVEDMSFNGCRLRTDLALQSGQLVQVSIPEALPGPEVAEVRWVRHRRGTCTAGLLFRRDDHPESENP
ncbi:MAG TPA: glycosyltransferase [Ornithinimicrobium sp.]|uniref:glycosyltransferase n=1 Tax=Ornithinimicrobium sp. TaxID=1977084 RepID=UPI002B47DEF9|nr:glycosyltransferase [Ornithinimicrobium sp.]HKJ11380.1 glycosyltransferase [Ornithinimicrobium sp.]